MALSGSATRKVYFKRDGSGAIDFAGIVAKGGMIWQMAVFGALDFVGAIIPKGIFKRAIAGTVDFAGSILQKANFKRIVSGALDYVGTVAKQSIFYRAVSGAFSFVGTAVEYSPYIFYIAVDGVIGFVGTIGRKGFFKYALSSSLNFAGSIFYSLPFRQRIVSGVLTFIGLVPISVKAVRRGLGRLGFHMKEN